jgi:hypothetical protein
MRSTVPSPTPAAVARTPPLAGITAPSPTADATVASTVNRLPFTPVAGAGAYDGCVWEDAGDKVSKPHGAIMGNYQCCNGAWIKGGCGGAPTRTD